MVISINENERINILSSSINSEIAIARMNMLYELKMAIMIKIKEVYE